MKKTIITAIFVVAAPAAFSQNKHLPAKVTITLTAQEALRIDSAVQAGANSFDSKKASQSFGMAFAPFYQQVSRQLVVDSVKVKK